MDYTQVLLRPVISEKGTFLKESENKVAFMVHKDANKIEIKKAVEKAFEVKVDSVNVVRLKPRARLTTHGYRRQFGRVPGYKKAYVTLAPGNSIEFFEGV